MILPNKRAGDSIDIQISVRNGRTDPPQLIDPALDLVQIKLYNPIGTVIVNLVAMTRVSLGVYLYTYHSQITDINGVWNADFHATDSNGNGAVSLEMEVFNLVT